MVAEFAEKTEEERSKRFSKWRFLLDVKNNLTTKAFQKIETSNTVMPISFETLRRGTQWLITKTEEAPGSNDRKKRGDGWKNRKKTSSRVKT